VVRRTAPTARRVSGGIGADEAQIEASFCAAINTAKEQKSVSLAKLEKRAEATYAEHRRQKSERVRRTWIPTTSLLTRPIPGSHELVRRQKGSFNTRTNLCEGGFSGSGKIISKGRETATVGRSE
jgi:hypothetical protein